jgi:hypothetical protein
VRLGVRGIVKFTDDPRRDRIGEDSLSAEHLFQRDNLPFIGALIH